MAVIVGQTTSVTLSIASAGIISINWARSSAIERLYTLGAGIGACGPPQYATIMDSQVTVSFSIYGGNSTQLDSCASKAAGVCANSPATVIATVVPGVCGNAQVEPLVDQKVFINNYSYSKERTGAGTEQWSGMAYKLPPQNLPAKQYVKAVPNFVILGVAEGTIECEISPITTTMQNLVGAQIAADAIVTVNFNASVQASPMSVGEQMFIHGATFSKIGGSQFWDPAGTSGIKCKASVSLTLQPIWTGTPA